MDTMLPFLNEQLSFNRWANQQWIDWVYQLDPSDPYPYRLINHIVKAERAWIQRVDGSYWDRDLWNIETKPNLESLEDDMLKRMLELSSARLDVRVEIQRLNGDRYQPRIADILQHILLHGTHHRGQLAAFASRRQMHYPSIDYMQYCIANGL